MKIQLIIISIVLFIVLMGYMQPCSLIAMKTYSASSGADVVVELHQTTEGWYCVCQPMDRSGTCRLYLDSQICDDKGCDGQLLQYWDYSGAHTDKPAIKLDNGQSVTCWGYNRDAFAYVSNSIEKPMTENYTIKENNKGGGCND